MKNLYKVLSKFEANYWVMSDDIKKKDVYIKYGSTQNAGDLLAAIPHKSFLICVPFGKGNMLVHAIQENPSNEHDLSITTQGWSGKLQDFDKVWTEVYIVKREERCYFNSNADLNEIEASAKMAQIIKELNTFLWILNSPEYRTGTKKQVYFNKTKKQKIRRSVDITYITNKRYIGTPKAPGGNEVEWSHSWQVRGHWRKHEVGLGKDREGYRVELGRTWVIPYRKQTQLEYKNKPRIIGA